MYKREASHISKSYFTFFYDRARQNAFTTRNIRSGWKNTGLNPWNPNIVLDTIQRPQTDILAESLTAEVTCYRFQVIQHAIETPKTSDNLVSLRRDLKAYIFKDRVLDTPLKLRICKIANITKNAFVDRTFLLNNN